MFSASTGLSDSARRRLDRSWAPGFRVNVLGILLSLEEEFAELYSDETGRPNWSIARMLALEILKEVHNLDDQSALDALVFDVRWQHALDLSPEEAYLSRRSQVEFRSRLVSLDPEMKRIRMVFDRVGDEALAALGLSTRDQRIDSTRIVSNIRTGGRVNLFRKTLEHFGHELEKRWPAKLGCLSAELRDWLGEERTGWFGAGTKEQQRRTLQQLAQWLYEVEATFVGDDEVTATEPYQLVVRLLREHCRIDEVEVPIAVPASDETGTTGEQDPADEDPSDDGAQTTPDPEPAVTTSAVEQPPDAECEVEATQSHSETSGEGEAASDGADAGAEPDREDPSGATGSVHVLKKPAVNGPSLQSPYDPDAAYGHKGCGYHVQITETCNNDGPEIITDFDVVPANEPDWGKTDGALDRLAAANRLPERLFADGGYPTGESILYAESLGTELIAPVTRPRLPEDAIGREGFTFDETTGDVVACPAGHPPIRHDLRSSINEPDPTRHAFFDGDTCRSCPLRGRCIARPPNNGKKGHFHLELLPRLRARDEAFARQKEDAWWEEYKIRAGMEATVSEVKRAHGLGRLRVRRLARVGFAVACKLTACNVKRWLRDTGKQAGGGAPHPDGDGLRGATTWATRAGRLFSRLWGRLFRRHDRNAPTAPRHAMA